MPGTSIIGHGTYRNMYTCSREGDAPLFAFGPHKLEMVIYFAPGRFEGGMERVRHLCEPDPKGVACKDVTGELLP